MKSARLRRRIRYGLALGGVAGVVALLIVVLGNHPTTNAPISKQNAQLAQVEKRAPRDPASVQIGREFLETAVLRKNLDWAYDHTHAYIKGRLTRAQWDKGNIPVIPYPAENIATAQFLTIYSYQTEVLFDVDLVARPGTHVRPHLDFYMGLRRAGGKANGRWLVSYWEPNWRPPIPVTP